MLIARQSTARTVTVGPVLDADGVAVTTAVVGDFKLSKNGGAPAAMNGSATLTHRHTGHYSLALTATDTDTIGAAEVVIDATTNACPPKEISVLDEAVYDVLFGTTAPSTHTAAATQALVAAGAVASVTGAVGSVTGAVGSVTGNVGGNVTGSVGSVVGAVGSVTGAVGSVTGNVGGSVASVATGGITAASIADGAIDAATFAADVDAEILSYLVDDATRIDASALNTATVTTVPAILVDTAEIGVAGAGLTEAGGTGDHLTAVPWNAAWDAEVQSEVADALTAYSAATFAAVAAVEADTQDIQARLPAALVSGRLLVDVRAVDGAIVDVDTAQFGTRVVDISGGVVTTIQAGLATPTNITAGTITTVTTLTNLPTAPTDWLSAAAVSAAGAAKIADVSRRRTQANVEASSDGDTLSVGSLYGFIQQVQESSIAGTTQTIRKTDGATTLGTKTVTVDAAADPITGIS